MTRSEILYAILFIGTFPALWTLAAILDRMLPDNSGHHSPKEARDRQNLLDINSPL